MKPIEISIRSEISSRPLPSNHYVVKYIGSWSFKRTINHTHTTQRTSWDGFQSCTQKAKNQENPKFKSKTFEIILKNSNFEIFF